MKNAIAIVGSNDNKTAIKNCAVIDRSRGTFVLNKQFSKSEAESWAKYYNKKVIGNGGSACYKAMTIGDAIASGYTLP